MRAFLPFNGTLTCSTMLSTTRRHHMRRDPAPSAAQSAPREVPDTGALFAKRALVERHPNLLKATSVAWALRNRAKNGLETADAVFEAQSGELLLYEHAFLHWYLGLAGRRKSRAARDRARSARRNRTPLHANCTGRRS